MRFQYESRDAAGQWWRSYGNELWEFDEHGLMRRREASINDVAIGITAANRPPAREPSTARNSRSSSASHMTGSEGSTGGWRNASRKRCPPRSGVTSPRP